MKRFHVVLILVGGLALGNASATAEVIQGGDANDKRLVNAKFSKQDVKQPAKMGTRRGDRFQKKTALTKHAVKRKKSDTSGKINRSLRQNSSTQLRTFPVVRIGSSGPR